MYLFPTKALAEDQLAEFKLKCNFTRSAVWCRAAFQSFKLRLDGCDSTLDRFVDHYASYDRVIVLSGSCAVHVKLHAGDNLIDQRIVQSADIEQNADAYREVRASFFADKATLPASTLLQITRLANPSYLIEVEATAVLPPKA
jgi:enamine deaminase RidA (YjgF/YER057c/UK114 family)